MRKLPITEKRERVIYLKWCWATCSICKKSLWWNEWYKKDYYRKEKYKFSKFYCNDCVV